MVSSHGFAHRRPPTRSAYSGLGDRDSSAIREPWYRCGILRLRYPWPAALRPSERRRGNRAQGLLAGQRGSLWPGESRSRMNEAHSRRPRAASFPQRRRTGAHFSYSRDRTPRPASSISDVPICTGTESYLVDPRRHGFEQADEKSEKTHVVEASDWGTGRLDHASSVWRTIPGHRLRVFQRRRWTYPSERVGQVLLQFPIAVPEDGDQDLRFTFVGSHVEP
jgi:hypothetical protein